MQVSLAYFESMIWELGVSLWPKWEVVTSLRGSAY